MATKSKSKAFRFRVQGSRGAVYETTTYAEAQRLAGKHGVIERIGKKNHSEAMEQAYGEWLERRGKEGYNIEEEYGGWDEEEEEEEENPRSKKELSQRMWMDLNQQPVGKNYGFTDGPHFIKVADDFQRGGAWEVVGGNVGSLAEGEIVPARTMYQEYMGQYETQNNPEPRNVGEDPSRGAANAKYLQSISPQLKNKILTSIARRYGDSVQEVEGILTDPVGWSEDLYEYIGNDSALQMQVYRDWQRRSIQGMPKKNPRSKKGNPSPETYVYQTYFSPWWYAMVEYEPGGMVDRASFRTKKEAEDWVQPYIDQGAKHYGDNVPPVMGIKVKKNPCVGLHFHGDEFEQVTQMAKELGAGGKQSNPKWIQAVDKEIEEKGTEGAFTAQARKAGYTDTMDFARKVMNGWKSGKKVYNKRTGKMQTISLRTMRRANFAINVQKRRRNPRAIRGEVYQDRIDGGWGISVSDPIAKDHLEIDGWTSQAAAKRALDKFIKGSGSFPSHSLHQYAQQVFEKKRNPIREGGTDHAEYPYKVFDGRKQVAESTTKKEAEKEAKKYGANRGSVQDILGGAVYLVTGYSRRGTPKWSWKMPSQSWFEQDSYGHPKTAGQLEHERLYGEVTAAAMRGEIKSKEVLGEMVRRTQHLPRKDKYRLMLAGAQGAVARGYQDRRGRHSNPNTPSGFSRQLRGLPEGKTLQLKGKRVRRLDADHWSVNGVRYKLANATVELSG